MPTSLIPPGMTRLPRFVFYPYGPRTSPSFTLAMYGAGYGVIAYRLTMCVDRGASKPVFAGTVKPPANTPAMDVASDIIKALAVAPGDTDGESTEGLSPEQLGILLTHGQALRASAAKRFGWTPEEAKPLRADLPAVFSKRRMAEGFVHRAVCGAAHVEASTKHLAKVALRAAILNHVSATPVFRVNPALRTVIAVYPHGATWEAQTIGPDGAVGQKYHLQAKDLVEANAAVDALLHPRRKPSGVFARVNPGHRRAVG